MNDMSSVIVPKSDQINSDDFIAGPQTITIRDVRITGGQEQPVSIYFEGSEKAFRPCKSMSRVLVHAWGPDAKVYVGRSLTLYRDPTVKWGGLEVGGIRISHMSDIDGKLQMQLTATKGQRKPHVVMPMAMTAGRPDSLPVLLSAIAECNDKPGLRQWWERNGEKIPDTVYDQVFSAFNARLAAIKNTPPPASAADVGSDVEAVPLTESEATDALPIADDSQTGERNFALETADRLISDVNRCTDASQLGFSGDDLTAYSELPIRYQDQVDAAVEKRRGELAHVQ